MHRHLLWICVLFTLFAPASLRAQDATPPATPPATTEPTSEDEPTVTASQQAVDPDRAISDTRIARRLREILEATERFTGLEVESRDGVVFLRGTTSHPDARALAAALAHRTQGVAAVVNNIRVDEGPTWTLQPAADELRSIWRSIIRALPLLVIGLAILFLSILVAGAVSRAVARLLTRRTGSELLRSMLRKTVFVLVIIVGVYLCLRISGLTRAAITIVSGTGLIGLVLGFAFRDIAENFLASILLSIQRPFRIGDVIEVDGKTGVVRKVTSRGTLLIDFDGNHIQLSNSTVYKNTIKNLSANPRLRINFSVGIGYDDDIATAQATVRNVLREHPAVLDEPEPLVLVEQLGASAVTLRVYFWINGAEHSSLKVKSAALRLTVGALNAAGISMPDEAREVIFPKGVPLVPPHEGSSPPSPSRPAVEAPPGPARRASTVVATEAEGDLTTETDDLNRQAAASRDPDQGANVLPTEAPDR
jgi:small-conductance mechanosensitive channel